MRRLLLFCAVAAAACSGTSSPGGCASPVHDPFDPRSVVHVLPGVQVPPYLTNPPTSGEHQPVDILLYRGVRTTPILPQIQVALLESSQVLVQYRSPGDAAALASLTTNPLVTVAPDPSLPASVVASAWQWRLVCPAPPRTLDTIKQFVAAHAGRGPQAPPP